MSLKNAYLKVGDTFGKASECIQIEFTSLCFLNIRELTHLLIKLTTTPRIMRLMYHGLGINPGPEQGNNAINNNNQQILQNQAYLNPYDDDNINRAHVNKAYLNVDMPRTTDFRMLKHVYNTQLNHMAADRNSFFYEALKLRMIRATRVNDTWTFVQSTYLPIFVDQVYRSVVDPLYEYLDCFVEQILAAIHGRRSRQVLCMWITNNIPELFKLEVNLPLKCNANFTWHTDLDLFQSEADSVRMPSIKFRDEVTDADHSKITFYQVSNTPENLAAYPYFTHMRNMIKYFTEEQQKAMVKFLYFHVYKCFIDATDNRSTFSFADTLTMIMKTSKNAVNPVSVFVDPAVKAGVLRIIYHKPGSSIKCDSHNSKLQLFYNPEHRLSVTQYVKYNDKKIFKILRKYANNGGLSLLPAAYIKRIGEIFPKLVSELISSNNAQAKKLKANGFFPISNEVVRQQG